MVHFYLCDSHMGVPSQLCLGPALDVHATGLGLGVWLVACAWVLANSQFGKRDLCAGCFAACKRNATLVAVQPTLSAVITFHIRLPELLRILLAC